MPAPRLLPVLLLTTLALAGCGGSAAEQQPSPQPTAFSLPATQAEQYRTAYVAQVVAAPEGDDLAAGAGEHAVIANNADIRIDMGGWTLVSAGGQRLPLGIGRQIDVGAQLRVHSSCGDASEQAVFACLDQEALDDAQGFVVLLDAADTEVARLQYPVG